MKRNGFPVVEALIVVAIMAILAAIIVPTVLNWGKDKKMIQPPLMVRSETISGLGGVVVLVDNSDKAFTKSGLDVIELELDRGQISGARYVICLAPAGKFQLGDKASVALFYYRPDDMSEPATKSWVLVKR